MPAPGPRPASGLQCMNALLLSFRPVAKKNAMSLARDAFREGSVLCPIECVALKSRSQLLGLWDLIHCLLRNSRWYRSMRLYLLARSDACDSSRFSRPIICSRAAWPCGNSLPAQHSKMALLHPAFLPSAHATSEDRCSRPLLLDLATRRVAALGHVSVHLVVTSSELHHGFTPVRTKRHRRYFPSPAHTFAKGRAL